MRNGSCDMIDIKKIPPIGNKKFRLEGILCLQNKAVFDIMIYICNRIFCPISDNVFFITGRSPNDHKS